MRIEAHNSLGKPIVADITRLLVCDDFGNPMAVAVDIGSGGMVVAVNDDDPARAEEFRRILQAFGIQRTAIVKTFEQTPLHKKKFVKDI